MCLASVVRVRGTLRHFDGELQNDLPVGPPVTFGYSNQVSVDCHLAIGREQREPLIDHPVGLSLNWRIRLVPAL